MSAEKSIDQLYKELAELPSDFAKVSRLEELKDSKEIGEAAYNRLTHKIKVTDWKLKTYRELIKWHKDGLVTNEERMKLFLGEITGNALYSKTVRLHFPEGDKTCKICGETKSEDEFPVLRHTCKECKRKMDKSSKEALRTSKKPVDKAAVGATEDRVSEATRILTEAPKLETEEALLSTGKAEDEIASLAEDMRDISQEISTIFIQNGIEEDDKNLLYKAYEVLSAVIKMIGGQS